MNDEPVPASFVREGACGIKDEGRAGKDKKA